MLQMQYCDEIIDLANYYIKGIRINAIKYYMIGKKSFT